MRTAFLTGGTGFLGGHVAGALVREGWNVRALVRDPSRADRLASLGARIVAGDLSAAADLEQACQGCDAVVHVAGLVKARTLQQYREVNAQGTQTLLRAASRSAPGALFLLVSSQAAAGPARAGRPVTEEDAPRPVSWYGLSKREAEQAVASLWPGPRIVVRPGVVYGPGDRGLLVLFRAAARGILPVPGAERRIQVIAAEEVALAVALAAGRADLAGRTGFLCDPEPVSIEHFCRALAALPGRRPRLIRVPDLALRAAGALGTLAETVTRRSLPLNADKAGEILAGEWLCDSGPFRKDLGLPPPTPLEDGLRRTWEWYVDRGWIVL